MWNLHGKLLAARLSGRRPEALEELDASFVEGSGFLSVWLMRLKRWTFSQSQHLNFFTILVLASVSIKIS
jgi:hypothetical protein